jgi:uncharacterized repeat protein (TIGR03847 family)
MRGGTGVPAEEFEFGRVDQLDAEAIGPPGQRRFRLTVLAEDKSASLWMEKEQVAALGTAMEQQLVRSNRPRSRTARQHDEEPPLPLPLNPSVDFRVGQLALGYDEEHGLFILQAHGREGDDQGQITLNCTADHDQARRLIRKIATLMSSGRPVCPLCGATIEGEHHCPRSNGHAEVVLR